MYYIKSINEIPFNLKSIIIILIGVISLSICQVSLIQSADKEKDFFYLDALNFYTPDSTKSRLDVYIEFPLNNLEFSRSKLDPNVYSSKIDFTVEIMNNEGRNVVNKFYKEEIITARTDIEYLSENSKIIVENYYLEPGKYKLKVTSNEQSTKKSFSQERDVSVRDFLVKQLSISDVMVLSRYEVDNNKKSITPDISRNVYDMDTFYLFFFVYKSFDDSKIDINVNIRDSKNNLIYNIGDFLDSSKGLDFQNQVFIKVPLPNLSFDNYSTEITVISSQYSSTITAGFVYMNKDFPLSLKNIDLLVLQLQYVANETELSYIKDGKTDAEKRKRFLEFWKSKDPTPNTKKNETMIEYYGRLKYANAHFSTPYSEGWKSDMGMVYIIFGLPSNIDRHPYEMGTKPYEVWDYYDINREFVFVDETGFGDYRLITPIYDDLKFKK